MFKQYDPAKSLLSAINVLDQFTLRNEKVEKVKVSGLKVHNGNLKISKRSFLKRVADTFLAFFSYRKRKKITTQKNQVQHVVLQAIEYVKSHYLLIHKFQNGTDEEKQIAHSALEAIKKYNAIVAKNKTTKTLFNSAIDRFFSIESKDNADWMKNSIEMPHVFSLHQASKTQDVKITTAFLNQVALPQSELVNKLEADAIRMKANTLIKAHGIPFKSASEIMNSLKSAPIHAIVDKSAQISTLYLTLDVFPGVKVKIRGSFKRDPISKGISLPISDSFKLFYQSVNLGFPHPLQRAGFALDDVLVPPNPHRLDYLPLFSEIYLKKQSFSKEILTNSLLMEKTKTLLEKKRQLFSKQVKELIALNKEFSKEFLKRAFHFYTFPRIDVDGIVDGFYEQVLNHSEPFEFLAENHHLINTTFLENPNSKLQQAWLNHHPSLLNKEAEKLHEAAKAILQQEIESAKKSLKESIASVKSEKEKISLSYLLLMGEVISSASLNILLQHWSEPLRSLPPMLNDFEQRVQFSLMIQLDQFLNELNIDLNTIELRERLLLDIKIFKDDALDETVFPLFKIVDELEEYYNMRYYLNQKRVLDYVG